MLDKLSEVEKRYEEIEHRLYDPSVVADVEQYRQLMKESAALQPIVEKYREYTAAKRYAEEARGLLDGGGLDKEMRELAEQELAENREKAEACAEELKLLLLPPGSQRPAQCHCGNPGGRGRGGIGPVREFTAADVHHVRRAARLRHRGDEPQRNRAGRLQRGQLYGDR